MINIKQIYIFEEHSRVLIVQIFDVLAACSVRPQQRRKRPSPVISSTSPSFRLSMSLSVDQSVSPSVSSAIRPSIRPAGPERQRREWPSHARIRQWFRNFVSDTHPSPLHPSSPSPPLPPPPRSSLAAACHHDHLPTNTQLTIPTHAQSTITEQQQRPDPTRSPIPLQPLSKISPHPDLTSILLTQRDSRLRGAVAAGTPWGEAMSLFGLGRCGTFWVHLGLVWF